MRLIKIVVSTAALMASASIPATERPASDVDRNLAEALKELSATQYEIDSASAPIKTARELSEHLSTSPRSPVNRLQPAERTAFLKSMVFTDYGLASYSYLPLQKLSISEAYAVLSLFGEQRAIGAIPGMAARSSIERSMLFVSRAGRFSALGEADPPLTEAEPLPHQACVVDGGASPTSWCEPSPGSMCNPKCK